MEEIHELRMCKQLSEERERQREESSQARRKRSFEKRERFRSCRKPQLRPRTSREANGVVRPVSPLNTLHETCYDDEDEEGGSPMTRLERTVYSMAGKAAAAAAAAPIFKDEAESEREFWARELGPCRLAWEMHAAVRPPSPSENLAYIQCNDPHSPR